MPAPAPAIPWFDAVYFGAACCYLLHLLVAALPAPMVGGRGLGAMTGAARLGRVALAAGLLLHVAGLLLRGRAIAFFPLTNKLESFYAFSFALFCVTWLARRSPSRLHRLLLPLVGGAFYGATLAFERGTFFPPPLMNTIWYPLHVPASFFAYALWSSAATAAVAVLAGARDKRLLRQLEAHAFWGWCLFSVSMLFGGAWGFVAWGAYFLWDPKVLWSVILWLFYSGYVHLRYWPAMRQPRPRALLALVGFAIMLVAYVGTSFLFEHGSHSFR